MSWWPFLSLFFFFAGSSSSEGAMSGVHRPESGGGGFPHVFPLGHVWAEHQDKMFVIRWASYI